MSKEKRSSLPIVDKNGIYRYINAHGYEHCDHKNQELIPVTVSWGNRSFICNYCGMVAKKELTSTSL